MSWQRIHINRVIIYKTIILLIDSKFFIYTVIHIIRSLFPQCQFFFVNACFRNHFIKLCLIIFKHFVIYSQCVIQVKTYHKICITVIVYAARIFVWTAYCIYTKSAAVTIYKATSVSHIFSGFKQYFRTVVINKISVTRQIIITPYRIRNITVYMIFCR